MRDTYFKFKALLQSDLSPLFIIGLIILLLLGFFQRLSLEQRGTEFDTYHGENVLRVGSMPIQTIDPRYYIPPIIAFALYEGLVKYGPDFRAAPAIAESWETNDNQTYTFHLRKDKVWSNGDRVTAHDFKYSWIRLANPLMGGGWWYSSGLRFIKNFRKFAFGGITSQDDLGIKVIDDWTLQITLERPLPYFVDMLLISSALPVHQATVEKFEGSWIQPENFVGNGPFVPDSWILNSSLSLVKNTKWVGERGNLDRIFILFGTSGLAAYENNEVDITAIASISEIKYCESNQKISNELFEVPTTGRFIFQLLTSRDEFLDDERVRQALCMGFDKEKVLTTITHGVYIPINDLVPPVQKQTKTNRGLDFNLEKARQLLAEAGYPNGRGAPAVKIYCVSLPAPLISVVAAFKEEIEKNLNVPVIIDNMEAGVFTQRVYNEVPKDPIYYFSGNTDPVPGEMHSLLVWGWNVYDYVSIGGEDKQRWLDLRQQYFDVDNDPNLSMTEMTKKKNDIRLKYEHFCQIEHPSPYYRKMRELLPKIGKVKTDEEFYPLIDEALEVLNKSGHVINYFATDARILLKPYIKKAKLNPFASGYFLNFEEIMIDKPNNPIP
ncbi:peptide ABC transporter substrate-binding protein [candidate division KSB1 bacterium]|nr:peptide ABC transporter substrate-binding protein [candidate division KSB1 bacterium]